MWTLAKTKSYRQYTEEEKQFLKSNYKGISTKELTRMYNEKFEHKKSVKQIKRFKDYRGLKNGINTKFQKGLTPTKNMKKYWFQKGHIPHNVDKVWDYKKGEFANESEVNHEGSFIKKLYKGSPVGTISEKDNKYVVKVAHPDVWVAEHRLVWEVYNGEIPEGKVVMALDGNIKNTKIENLRLVPRDVMLNMTSLGYHDLEPKVKEAGIKLTELIIKTREIELER